MMLNIWYVATTVSLSVDSYLNKGKVKKEGWQRSQANIYNKKTLKSNT